MCLKTYTNNNPTVHMSDRRPNMSRHNSIHRHYRVSVMGSAAVGKTCIVSQFLQGTCPSLYEPTVEDFHQQTFHQENDTSVVLDIVDMTGTYTFPAMRRLAISTSDAFVLVYAVNDMTSFEEVTRIREQIIGENGNEAKPIVIVGNKCDVPKEHRLVDGDMVERMVTVDWDNVHLDTSATNNINVTDIFEELMRQADLNMNIRLNLPHNSFDHIHDCVDLCMPDWHRGRTL